MSDDAAGKHLVRRLRVFAPMAVAMLLTVVALVPLLGGRARPQPVQVATRAHVAEPDAVYRSPAAAHRPAPAAHTALAPCPRRASACVDTRHRLAWLQHDGRVVYGPVPVALGSHSHPTPRGVFHVAYKGPHWVSTEYGIPMPWAVFFATGGIAFHQGPLTEASHGCVHLRHKDALAFYDALQPHDVVSVR